MCTHMRNYTYVYAYTTINKKRSQVIKPYEFIKLSEHVYTVHVSLSVSEVTDLLSYHLTKLATQHCVKIRFFLHSKSMGKKVN